MVARLHGGPIITEGDTDDDAYRTYTVAHIVQCSRTEHAATVMRCPGLPLPGAIWKFQEDEDIFCFCYPWMNARHLKPKEGDPNEWWRVTQKFSNKPLDTCRDNNNSRREDPLLEPPKINGGHSRYSHEATHDRFGRAILTSSWERYKGSDVEFDRNRPDIKVSINTAVLGMNIYSPMIDTVNDQVLWDFNPRCVKLSNVNFDRNTQSDCNYYFTRHFEFEVNPKTFDRILPDEGTRVLSGHWDTSEKTSMGVGAGCKVWIRASAAGGLLTYVEIAKDPADPSRRLRGYGYPASSNIKMRLLGGGGAGAIIYATTDANGQVDTVRIETNADTGYPFGLGSGYSSSPAVNPLYFGAGPNGGPVLKGSIATSQITDSCTVTLTTVSGTSGVPSPIATATLNTAGVGYPANSKIRLTIIGGSGSGGIVTAQTNSSGVVTSVTLITAGSGYIPTVGAATMYSPSVWVLDPINGQEPDRFNPSHFIKYTDAAGHPQKVLLDGTGRPAVSPMFYDGIERIGGDPAFQKVEYYPESNFLLLGIPLSLESGV